MQKVNQFMFLEKNEMIVIYTLEVKTWNQEILKKLLMIIFLLTLRQKI